MKGIGVITGILREWLTGKITVTIRFERDFDPDVLNELMAKERLSVEIKPYRESRSLSANNYFHSLCGQLARAQDPPVSPAYMKNTLIARYGQHEYVGEDLMVYKTNAPVEYMLQLEDLHTWPAKGGEGGTTFYYVFRGSHTYDTKEMAVLIDGTIEECKKYGIDTKTDRELYDMLERWGDRGKKAS